MAGFLRYRSVLRGVGFFTAAEVGLAGAKKGMYNTAGKKRFAAGGAYDRTVVQGEISEQKRRGKYYVYYRGPRQPGAKVRAHEA